MVVMCVQHIANLRASHRSSLTLEKKADFWYIEEQVRTLTHGFEAKCRKRLVSVSVLFGEEYSSAQLAIEEKIFFKETDGPSARRNELKVNNTQRRFLDSSEEKGNAVRNDDVFLHRRSDSCCPTLNKRTSTVHIMKKNE